MLIEITGGSGSGKSEYAESCCIRLCPGEKYYIATMEPFDVESRERVLRHRKLREGKQFTTIECPTGLRGVELEKGSTVLLECLSNLVANEMYSPRGCVARMQEQQPGCVNKDAGSCNPSCEQIADRLLEDIRHLAAQTKHLVIVTNQVFSDGISYDSSTTEYMKILAMVNNSIARMADQVWEVVCGIPICIKAD